MGNEEITFLLGILKEFHGIMDTGIAESSAALRLHLYSAYHLVCGKTITLRTSDGKMLTANHGRYPVAPWGGSDGVSLLEIVRRILANDSSTST